MSEYRSSLEKYGIYFDDLNRLKVLDEATGSQALELKDTCYNFLSSVSDFQTIAGSFIKIFDSLSNQVEKEKIYTIGLRNLLQSYSKHRELEVQQLSSLIREKQHQYERLRVEYEAFKKLESNQVEFMEQFVLQK
nr:intraflagellar transport protein 20 homolog isoform X1 [Lepeophtheirus salmonis]